jgi:hypothetical protein
VKEVIMSWKIFFYAVGGEWRAFAADIGVIN